MQSYYPIAFPINVILAILVNENLKLDGFRPYRDELIHVGSIPAALSRQNSATCGEFPKYATLCYLGLFHRVFLRRLALNILCLHPLLIHSLCLATYTPRDGVLVSTRSSPWNSRRL